MKKSLTFAVSMTLLFCASLCFNANAQDASPHIIEKLADGTYIVAIEGANYRAISPDQMRQLLEQKVEREALKTENALQQQRQINLEKENELLRRDKEFADLQRDAERKRAEEFKKLFEDERELRKRAEKLPKKPNKFVQIISHPAVVGMILVIGRRIIGGR